MPSTRLLVASDARVRGGEPNKNFGGVSKLSVAGGSDGRLSFVYFNRPFPLGVTILSATLRLYQRAAATGGSRTLTVQSVSSEWSESRITFANRPFAGGPTATLTKGNSTDPRREWAFDVKAALQAVADGGSWFGLRVIADNATILDFYAKEGGGQYTPVLEVSWSDAPAAPTQLSPSGGRSISVARPTLRCDFFDPDGDLSQVQFQVSPSTGLSTSFSPPAFDSGEIPAELPEWKLSSDLTVDTTYMWRARVQDAAGLWSPWSDPATFRRTAKPAVTLTNPPAATPTVFEPTPTFSWTVGGGQQWAYQLFIMDADGSTVLWTSNKITSASTSHQLPAKQRFLLTPGTSYQLVLRVWDAVARETVPEESSFVQVARDFDFGSSGAVSPVTNLQISVEDGTPFASLEFERDVAPDEFIIIEGGKTIAVVEPADIRVSGTKYRYIDRRAAPRSTRTWGVAARADMLMSDFVTVTGRSEPEGVWLYSLDSGDAVCIWGGGDDAAVASTKASEDTSVHKPVGSPNPVLITQSTRGPEGDVAGTIDREHLAAWDRLSSARAVTLGMTRIDLAQKVQIFNTWRDNADEFDNNIIPIAFDFVVVL